MDADIRSVNPVTKKGQEERECSKKSEKKISDAKKGGESETKGFRSHATPAFLLFPSFSPQKLTEGALPSSRLARCVTPVISRNLCHTRRSHWPSHAASGTEAERRERKRHH